MRLVVLIVAVWGLVQGTAVAQPFLIGRGQPAQSSTGNVRPTLPLGGPGGVEVGDILTVVAESSGATPGCPSGYTAYDNSPQVATGVRLVACWKRVTARGETPGTMTFTPGDHVLAFVFQIRGAAATGNPYDATAGDVNSSASTTHTVPSVTTLGVNRLIAVVDAASVADAHTTTSWTNGSLTALRHRYDTSTAEGDDGSLAFATGELATAGPSGATTITTVSSTRASLAIAFKTDTTPEYNFTRFVSPTGSSSSNCTAADPCSLTRLAAIACSTTIPSGTVVKLADGYYTTPTQGNVDYVFNGNCATGNPVKMVGQGATTITNLRLNITDSANWELAPGMQWTYVMDFDETALGFTPGIIIVMQRDPTNWQPIRVEDRQAPFTSLGRYFYFTYPINFTPFSSISAVEAQAGTFWLDATNNKLYVHMFHDDEPSTADDLYAGLYTNGDTYIFGDNLWLENVRFLKSGVQVWTTADRTTFKNVEFHSTGFDIRGTNGLFYGLHGHTTAGQGPLQAACNYNVNPTLTQAAICYNEGGTGGFGSILGNGNTLSWGVFHQAAGGISTIGPGAGLPHNKLEYNVIVGMSQHSFSAYGIGFELRGNFVNNTQEGFFNSGLGSTDVTMRVDDFIVENNTFPMNGVVMFASYTATRQGGLASTYPNVFKNNILSVSQFDDKVTRSFEASTGGGTLNCNLYINTAFILSVTETTYAPALGGGAEPATGGTWATVAAIQATGKGWEANGQNLAIDKWSDDTQFTFFNNMQQSGGNNYDEASLPVFDMTPVGGSTLETMNNGACGTVGATFGPIDLTGGFAPDPPEVTNSAPSNGAGSDQTGIELSATVQLNGTANDDGLPAVPGAMTHTWTMTSGTGTATFSNANSLTSTVTFSTTGVKVLTLTTTDGELSDTDTVSITVQDTSPMNAAPTVNAGPDQTSPGVRISQCATLIPTSVTDDGLPAAMTFLWETTVAPQDGVATFASATSLQTTVCFSRVGTYTFRLTATDTALSGNDTLIIKVLPPQKPPRFRLRF